LLAWCWCMCIPSFASKSAMPCCPLFGMILVGRMCDSRPFRPRACPSK
jgi:hypothetical protein